MRYTYKGKEISKRKANFMAYGSIALMIGTALMIYGFMRAIIG